jgi:hypothetical protein
MARKGYRSLDISDLMAVDAMKIISLPEKWDVKILKDGSLSIPAQHYDAVIHHLNKPDD